MPVVQWSTPRIDDKERAPGRVYDAVPAQRREEKVEKTKGAVRKGSTRATRKENDGEVFEECHLCKKQKNKRAGRRDDKNEQAGRKPLPAPLAYLARKSDARPSRVFVRASEGADKSDGRKAESQ